MVLRLGGERSSDLCVGHGRARILGSVLGLVASIVTECATAQDTASAQLEEVTVTGTRIIRSGFEAPTPTSVLDEDHLEAMAVFNIADAANRMPQFSSSTVFTNSSASDQTLGVQTLNLRSFGSTRVLVLLDGRRLVGGGGSNANAVDVNVIPNELVSRIEVVTGGASAVYGSDAITGVVNFLLDKEFTGVKGSVTGGITSRGDDESYQGSLAAGIPFADGRGHLLLSGETAYQAGIPHNDRPWNRPYALVANPAYTPTNGQPQYTALYDVGLSRATPGGLIVAGPLTGTMFGPGGTPLRFNYGPVVAGQLMQGGDWQVSRIDHLHSPKLQVERSNLFARASFDLTEKVAVFSEVGWARTDARSLFGVPYFHLGNVTVQADNPFIPQSVQARMAELGLESFTLGTTNADMAPFKADNRRIFHRYVLGVEGQFDALETTWRWEASFQRSKTDFTATIPNNEITANYRRAVDAVLDPETGQIVCRSTLTDPDDGCVPYNVMGIGVNSQAALDYITGTSFKDVDLEQNVFAASIAGDPFSTWAGPVSIAASFEYREESSDSVASELDQQAAFFLGNFTPTVGSYDVTEGALETVLPLASVAGRDVLDLNLAARFTSYSRSGEVTTWKAGATFRPLDDITLRVTRSRDIRAPNVEELFSAGHSSTLVVNDRGVETLAVVRTGGNPNLEPEEADTLGLGIVFQPSFLPGFGASVDYYEIELNGAISTLNVQTYVDRCNSGDAAACALIQRDSTGTITLVNLAPINVLRQEIRGIDVEVSYTFPLSNLASGWPGSLVFRGLASYIDTLKQINLDGSVWEGAGVLADRAGIGAEGPMAPRRKYLLSATYSVDALSATLTARGIGSGVYNNRFIYCTEGCPPSTREAPTIGIPNRISDATYFDLALSYEMEAFGKSELFFVAQNIFDRGPPLVAGATGNAFYLGRGDREYIDKVGRVFRAGIRFSF